MPLYGVCEFPDSLVIGINDYLRNYMRIVQHALNLPPPTTVQRSLVVSGICGNVKLYGGRQMNIHIMIFTLITSVMLVQY